MLLDSGTSNKSTRKDWPTAFTDVNANERRAANRRRALRRWVVLRFPWELWKPGKNAPAAWLQVTCLCGFCGFLVKIKLKNKTRRKQLPGDHFASASDLSRLYICRLLFIDRNYDPNSSVKFRRCKSTFRRSLNKVFVDRVKSLLDSWFRLDRRVLTWAKPGGRPLVLGCSAALFYEEPYSK